MGAGAEIFNQVINQQGSPALFSATLANRPAFGYTGRIFIATDTREIYRDTGTSWELIGSGGGSVNIYNSDGTLTGVRTIAQNNNDLTFIGGLVNFGAHASATDTRNIRVNQYASLGTITTSSYGAVGSNFYVNGANSLRTLNDSASSIHFLNGGHVFLNASNGAANTPITWTEAARILSNGRFLLGTTTDAGFLADFAGTFAVRGNASFFDNAIFNTTNRGITAANNNISINVTGARDVSTAFSFGLINAYNVANTNRSFFGFSSIPITYSSGTNATTIFNVNPSINVTGGTTALYGYRWNPNLIGTTGLTHYAIQTDSGIVDHYDRLDLTTSDFSSRNAWTLHARLRQTLTAGADQFGAGYYVGGLHIREISASGANTFGNATINAGGASTLQIDFTGAGTLTASQAGLRAFAGHQIFNTFGGSASGTITHFAGMQILGLYNRNTGVITPTITNAYGLIINNLNDYSHTFTLTNRWGLYQTGSLDNNYLAGKLLIGTTTVTARQVHIAGNIELTTTVSGTAGGSSGDHLSIWINGVERKIALLNP